MDGLSGGCDISWKTVLDGITIWGAGWLNSGFGHKLYDAIQSKDLSPSEWKFSYGIRGDGREWTVTLQTVIFSEDRIEEAIKEMANFQDWGVSCNA
jgi:hypothetical protein